MRLYNFTFVGYLTRGVLFHFLKKAVRTIIIRTFCRYEGEGKPHTNRANPWRGAWNDNRQMSEGLCFAGKVVTVKTKSGREGIPR